MKICIILLLTLLPLVFAGDIQTKISSEEYITAFELEGITIKHHYTLKIIEYEPPIDTDSSDVYEDLKYYYNKLDSTYIKFN